MPDAWTLITPAGPYQLNPSFTAPQYEPGGIAGPGALRRDDRAAYQRSGDGLRTPGALTLVGRVWRDDHNQTLMVAELNAIRNAVAACTSVTRTNNAGTYTYDHLAGGATPEITPDGLGGWLVRLDLWPGRAEPTFFPAPPDDLLFRDDFTSYTDGANLSDAGPYNHGVEMSFQVQYDPGVYGVPKNVAELLKGNNEGRAHAWYTGDAYASGRVRVTARVWTGLAHNSNRHLGVTAYYTHDNPYGNTGVFAVLYGNGSTFRIVRGTGTNTIETIASAPVSWSLSTWYEIELVHDASIVTATLRDATGNAIQTLTGTYTPPPATTFHSGLILHSQNNTSQRIAFDWVEFGRIP